MLTRAGIIPLLFISLILSATEPTEDELEQWFENDEQAQPYTDYSSDSSLQFLAPITNRPIPHSDTRLQISVDSLDSGWVGLEQCHEALDPVPDAEVVYRFRAMRGLRVTEASNIASAVVSEQSVQLKEVGHGARLCVAAEVQVLQSQASGLYLLRYGPFQRKFFDSYFPLHVTLAIYFPARMFNVVMITPAPEGAYSLSHEAGRIVADAWFSGELTFEFTFQAKH